MQHGLFVVPVLDRLREGTGEHTLVLVAGGTVPEVDIELVAFQGRLRGNQDKLADHNLHLGLGMALMGLGGSRVVALEDNLLEVEVGIAFLLGVGMESHLVGDREPLVAGVGSQDIRLDLEVLPKIKIQHHNSLNIALSNSHMDTSCIPFSFYLNWHLFDEALKLCCWHLHTDSPI